MLHTRCRRAPLHVLAVMLSVACWCLGSCRDLGAHTNVASSLGSDVRGIPRFDPDRAVEIRRNIEKSHVFFATDKSADGGETGSNAARRAAEVPSAPMRFGTMYDDLSAATADQVDELKNTTMPWVVSTLSRMFQIKNPADDMKIFPSDCSIFVPPNTQLPPQGDTVDAWICFESPNASAGANSGSGSSRLTGDYYVPLYICPPTNNLDSFTSSDLNNCQDLSGPKAPVPLDMVLRISTDCQQGSGDTTIAYSQPHDWDWRPAGTKVATSWRPAVATVVLCPLYFTLPPSGQFQTLTHELMHGMGFGTLLPLAQQVVGTPQQDDLYPTSSSASQVTQQVNLRGRQRTVATSQRVVEEARIQFGCQDLVGAELESTGGEGTALGHLAKRLFTGDLMVGYAPTSSGLEDLASKLDISGSDTLKANLLVMSRVELALMEDTGYYLPNYDEAGFLRFGYKGGCDFSSDDCSSWVAAHPGQDYFCTLPSSAEASMAANAESNYNQASQSSNNINVIAPAYIQYTLAATSCNADRSALGYCARQQLSTGEQCPAMQNEFGCNSQVFDQLVEEFDQSNVPNLVATGPNARCIAMSNVSLAGVIVGPTIEGGIYSGSTCLNMRCDSANQQVIVTIDSTDFNCPSEGTFDLATLPLTPSFSPNSIVYCPNYDEMCSTDTATDAAAEFGDLTCDQLAGCSSNGDCYKGVCYCKAGWTGCDCSMMMSDPAASSFNATTCQRWTSLSTDALDIGTEAGPNQDPSGVSTESSKSATSLPAVSWAALVAAAASALAIVAA